jgi:glutaredoxin
MMPTPPGINMQGLVLFGMQNCGGCEQAAQWLDRQGCSFSKYDVTTSREVILWLQQQTGQRTVPQFFLNGHHVQGGFQQLQQLAATGQLPKVGVTQIR